MSLLLVSRFRLALVALGVQYLAMFWFTATALPLGMAAVKLLVGWMITALFASMATTTASGWDSEKILSGKLLRFGVMVIMWVVIYLATPFVSIWLPVNENLLMGGLILLSGGLIQIGLSNRIMRICFGLLTLMSGFEIIYAALEPSVLVSGMLALVNIGIGLVGLSLVVIKGTENEVME